jgi:DNA (cytosine-5)-methyltransferase 1
MRTSVSAAMSTMTPARRVAELFAGVGGFRLGLEAAGWETVYSNQWEPSTKRQHASEVYVHHFGETGHSNEDIARVAAVPAEFELLVGGFPCQDYSVAKSNSAAAGLEGKKGVLWWEILRLVEAHKPRFIFLENVDRLLKSPSTQRGRDFAIMLSSLGNAGYSVEWRVINAADYGFPQRRRRVFIVAELGGQPPRESEVAEQEILASAFPIREKSHTATGYIPASLLDVSESFGHGLKVSPFRTAGHFFDGEFVTTEVTAKFDGPRVNLGDILVSDSEVPKEYFLSSESITTWRYLKGPKSEERTHSSGFKWRYSEGGMLFPDPIDRPSRTILTGEGGTSPSRFKHVVASEKGLRRLLPVELERLNGFPDGWTAFGVDGEMSDTKRAFFMGNALVVGLIERVGKVLASRIS